MAGRYAHRRIAGRRVVQVEGHADRDQHVEVVIGQHSVDPPPVALGASLTSLPVLRLRGAALLGADQQVLTEGRTGLRIFGVEGDDLRQRPDRRPRRREECVDAAAEVVVGEREEVVPVRPQGDEREGRELDDLGAAPLERVQRGRQDLAVAVVAAKAYHADAPASRALW